MTTSTELETWGKKAAVASPAWSDEEKKVVVSIYRLLAQGKPVSESQIAEHAGVAVQRVEDSLRKWPLVMRDDEDGIVGFWGLYVHHVEPTHAMTLDGNTVYGWCAMDTLFIPEILGGEVHVASSDPVDGTPIRLKVSPEGLSDLDPPEAVMSFLLPEDGEKITDNAIQKFCHQIYFFSSKDSAEQWIDDRPGLFTMSVPEAFEVGQTINRLRLGSSLEEVSQCS